MRDNSGEAEAPQAAAARGEPARGRTIGVRQAGLDHHHIAAVAAGELPVRHHHECVEAEWTCVVCCAAFDDAIEFAAHVITWHSGVVLDGPYADPRRRVRELAAVATLRQFELKTDRQDRV